MPAIGLNNRQRANPFVPDEPPHPAQLAAIRRMTLSERFAQGLRFLQSTRDLLAAGVRARHPGRSDAEIAAEVRKLIAHAGS